MRNPRLLVLNGSCLDTIEDHREWTKSQPVELIADASVRVKSVDEAVIAASGAHAIVGPIGCSIPPDFFERVPTLRAFALASSGFDSIEDPEAATRAGVALTFAPVEEGAEVVADYTWGLLLSLVRRIPQHYRALQEGRYERGLSTAVYGKTLGILGLGKIGKGVARRAAGFKMRILACDTAPDPNFVREFDIRMVGLQELLRESDFLSVHLRLNEDTRNLLGEKELAMMRPKSYLINTARDELVNESALLDALNRGQIAGAATDEAPRDRIEELLRHPNYLCTPHLGNRAKEGVFAVTRCALECAVDVLLDRRPPFLLNPKVYERGLRPIEPAEVAAS